MPQTSRNSILRDFHPSVLIPSLTAGLISGILLISLQLSFAALVFSGGLSPYLQTGIGLVLFSGIVIALVIAFTSSFPVTIASPQDSPAVLLALIASSISILIPENSPTTFATVAAALALTSMLTGALFFGLGVFRLGGLVRYIPYPVIGGFLAGTGWLLFQGGINVMTGTQLTPEFLSVLAGSDVVIRWLPGVVLGCVLLIVLRRWTHALLTPAILFIAILLFYMTLPLSGSTIEMARQGNWMLGPFSSEQLFQFVTPTAFLQANWTVLFFQADKIAAVVVVCVVGLLLNASGIELAVRRDIDFNRELRAAGIANFIAGIASGFPGYHTLGVTALSHRLGARSRLTGIVTAFLIAFTLFFGAALLEYVPRPVLGGLLVYLGIAFLVDWLYDAFFKLPRLDYALVVFITAVIAVFGFLPGVGVGILVAMALFILTYSRVRSVKQELTGATYRSSVDRSPPERAYILEHGSELWILQLQEFIFFGTGQTLLDRIRARIQGTTKPMLKYIVLDFQRVPGLDSSAVASFIRIQQLLESKQITLLLTTVSPPIQAQLKRGGLEQGVQWLPSLDAGVEWSENAILADSSLTRDNTFRSFETQLSQILQHPEDLERLFKYMERLELPADSYLIRQGEQADALYFVESGQVCVEVEDVKGKKRRIRTIHHSSVVGEIAPYWGGVRTASVIALEPTTVYRLSNQSLEEMDRRDPDLAVAIHRWIASTMAARRADDLGRIQALTS